MRGTSKFLENLKYKEDIIKKMSKPYKILEIRVYTFIEAIPKIDRIDPFFKSVVLIAFYKISKLYTN